MSKYQTSMETTNYNSSDRKLDELLEDLQSSVKSRPTLNGTSQGYREVYKSSQSHKTGQPMQASKEYEVEYLNPSNNKSVVSERPHSPYFEKENIPGKNSKSYKTVSYEYNTNTKRVGGAPSVQSYEYNKSNEKSGTKFQHNINELDSLLDDLNHKQKSSEFSSNSYKLNRSKDFDSGFLEPSDSSTPKKESHVSRIEERSYEKQYGGLSPIRHTEVKKETFYNGEPVETYSSINTTDMSKNSTFNGASLRPREPSPTKQFQELYHYKTESTSRRGAQPPITNSTRNYTYDMDVTDKVSPYSSESYVSSSTHEYKKSPSPVRSVNTLKEMKETKETTTMRRSPSPVKSYYSTTSTVHNVTPQPIRKTMYSATKTVQETTRRETPHFPSPPRQSPPPVSVPHSIEPPLETSIKTYNYEKSINRSQSPPPRESPVPGRTVVTRNYQYSSESHKKTSTPAEPYVPEIPTSFQTQSSSVEIKEQKPPKQLDELMASFSDSESHKEIYNTYNSVTRTSSITRNRDIVETRRPPSPTEKIIPIEKPVQKEKVNGVAGPPVYYPPGPLFKKEEECVIEKSKEGKGKMKASREAKYKCEAGGKMKGSSDTKKSVVPICAPLCCALPCVIM